MGNAQGENAETAIELVQFKPLRADIAALKKKKDADEVEAYKDHLAWREAKVREAEAKLRIEENAQQREKIATADAEDRATRAAHVVEMAAENKAKLAAERAERDKAAAVKAEQDKQRKEKEADEALEARLAEIEVERVADEEHRAEVKEAAQAALLIVLEEHEGSSNLEICENIMLQIEAGRIPHVIINY